MGISLAPRDVKSTVGEMDKSEKLEFEIVNWDSQDTDMSGGLE